MEIREYYCCLLKDLRTFLRGMLNFLMNFSFRNGERRKIVIFKLRGKEKGFIIRNLLRLKIKN